MVDYKTLTNEEINKLLSNAEDTVKQLKTEQNRRLIISTMNEQGGYAIVEHYVDLSSDGISNKLLTLPVTLTLDTRCDDPSCCEDQAQVDDYADHDDMPTWCDHLVYPKAPSDAFECNNDWFVDGCDVPYQGTGRCQFYIYYKNPRVKPNKSIYFIAEDDMLFMYELIDGKYYCYYHDEKLGTTSYQGLRFTLIDIEDKNDFSFNHMILLSLDDD